MRHRRAGLHLSRTAAHRQALWSNLVAALITNERIKTTDVKAKETRRLAERTITWARRVGDILVKKADKRTAEEKARVVHAVRMARRVVRDRDAVQKLFDEIAPRFLGRHGGYTRIVKIGERMGDAAPMSLLELIPGEGAPEKKAETKGGEGEKAGEAKAKTKSKAKAAAKAEGEGEAPAKKPRARKSSEKKSAEKSE